MCTRFHMKMEPYKNVQHSEIAKYQFYCLPFLFQHFLNVVQKRNMQWHNYCKTINFHMPFILQSGTCHKLHFIFWSIKIYTGKAIAFTLVVWWLVNFTGHTHLSHSFIIHAFLWNCWRIHKKSVVFPIPHSSRVYMEDHWTSCQAGRTSRAPRDVTRLIHSCLEPFESHDMREPCNPPEPRLSREEGGWVRKVSMAVH